MNPSYRWPIVRRIASLFVDSGGRVSWLAMLLLLLGQALVFAHWSISRESLWIDEFGSAAYASQSNFVNWWHLLRTDLGSDGQMPLYHIYLWFWGQHLGTSEYLLRLANLPLVLIGHLVLFQRFRGRPWLLFCIWGVATLHPLLWFYLNEARPYCMQYFGACLIVSPLLQWEQLLQKDAGRPDLRTSLSGWSFTSGLMILSGSSLLGVPWAGAGVLFLAYLLYSRRWLRLEILLPNRIALAAMVGLLCLLAIYYVDTLLQGAGASRVATTNLKTMVFSLYEILGFSGLGPGRLALRDSIAAIKPFLPGLAVMGITVGWTLFAAIKYLVKTQARKDLTVAAGCVLLPVVFVVGVGLTMHFRVLGRHLIPLLVVTMLLQALGIFWSSTALSWKKRVAGMAALLLLATSSFSLRLEARHAKDNYRQAAAISRQFLSDGATVWWSANPSALAYYRLANRSADLPRNLKLITPKLVLTTNVDEAFLATHPAPDVLILSKPDIYDKSGTLKQLAAHQYEKIASLSAFSVYQRSGGD
ncbi:hypothetical protein ACFL6E_06355 [Candidatus Neomarinimicrobiota bacterium]